MNNELIAIYITGIEWSIMLGIVVAILFAIGRWISCVKQYIKIGKIDIAEKSTFFGKHNWFWGKRRLTMGTDKNGNLIYQFYYSNNPWIIAFDIITISFVLSLLSLIWPISIIVVSVIIFAKWQRNIVVKKETFVNNLKGEHV